MDTKFEIIKQLGQGGQGKVFLVSDTTKKGRLVALKRPTDLSCTKEVLALEFSRLAALRHPNLATAYEFGEDDEGVYFTSEFVDGPPINEWARTVSRQDVVRALGGILRAVALLHDRDLVHGDISANNVLVQYYSKTDSYIPKLLDLGETCKPGQCGNRMTPGYAAPELITGRGALFSSDLYSFGALSVEILFGSSPFGTGEPSEILKRQLSGEIILPKAELSSIAALCRDLLQNDPSARPQTAAEVLKRLAEASDTELTYNISSLAAGELQLPAPRLIAREKEKSLLFDFVDRLHDESSFRVARIDGPSGSGRSTLMEEASRIAQLSGFEVIGSPNYITDSEHFLVALCRACPLEALSRNAALALCPWMQESLCNESNNIFDISKVTFAAIEALTIVSQSKPCLILVDDFDSVSKISREVVLAFARFLSIPHVGRPQVLMILSEQSQKPELQEFDSMHELAQPLFSLSPLDQAGTSKLVMSMLPGINIQKEFQEAVFVASGGLPKIAEEVVRQSIGNFNLTLSSLTTNKICELTFEEQLLLAVMSAADGPIPEPILQKQGFDAPQIASMVNRGFCYETGASYSNEYLVAKFAGISAREIVSKDNYLLSAEQMACELDKACLFRQAGFLWKSIEQLENAHNSFSCLAENRIGQNDYLGAAEWFEIALAQWDGKFDISKSAQKAVETWRAVGWTKQAREAIPFAGFDSESALLLKAELTMEEGCHLEALSLLKDTEISLTDKTKANYLIAACEMQLGRHERALSIVNETLSLPNRIIESKQIAEMSLIGALCCTYLHHFDRATTLFRDAEKGFTAENNELGRLRVLGNMGMLLRQKGDLAESRTQYDKAVQLAIFLGDRPREGLHRMNRATVAQTACNYADAYEDYLAALDITEILGNSFRTAQVEVNLADLLVDMGQGAQAAKIASRALKRCRQISQERLETRALLAAGRAALANGDLIRAELNLTEAKRRFSAAGDESGRIFAQLRIAELYLTLQDFRRAHETAYAAARDTDKKGFYRDRARALIIVARCEIAIFDNAEKALSLLDEAETAIRKETSLKTRMKIAVDRANILKRLGREKESSESMDLARSLFQTLVDKIPQPFQEGFIEQFNLPELTYTPLQDSLHSDRWARDLKMLMEINRELTSERDPKRLLSLIMESAVNLTGAERGMLVMPKSGKLEPVVMHQISDEVDKSFSRSVAERVLREGHAQLAVDALGDERFRAFVSVNALKLRSILAVPLKIKRRVVGAVYLDSRLQTGVFSDADCRLLEAFGAQAAVCLETSRLIFENQEKYQALEKANGEIRLLTEKLQEKLEKNEAKLARVGALLEKTQAAESERIKSDGMIGRSEAMQRVRKFIERIAPTNVPVYIYGQSGTGKELAARAVHSQSERKSKPFVAVNCGALPSNLLAGELFGHKKGAFTGAVADRSGLFKVADKGTLFLDEVSDMDKEMQTHLLRVLQDGTFRSLGDNEEISVDVRIIAASNRDLEEEIKNGKFREDLFYRLNVVRIDIPSLSERKDDIPLLADAISRKYDKNDPPIFTKEALKLLMNAEWPGNVRELENEILRAVTMADDKHAIGPEDLSPRFNTNKKRDLFSQDGTLKSQVAIFEDMTIRSAMEKCGGNASKTAKILGISRATLYKKLSTA